MKTKQLICGTTAGLFLFASSLLFAQSGNVSTGSSGDLPSNTESFAKGTNVINLGIGIGGEYTYIGSGVSSTPNFVISYDNGTFGNIGPGTISLGGLLSYKGSSYSYTDPYTAYSYDQKWNYYILGFRAAYHWNFTGNPKFDIYAGLMLAYYSTSYSLNSNDPYINNPNNPFYNSYNVNNYGSYVATSFYAGIRYYLSYRVGLWAELGYGYSNLAIGVNFKF